MSYLISTFLKVDKKIFLIELLGQLTCRYKIVTHNDTRENFKKRNSHNYMYYLTYKLGIILILLLYTSVRVSA